MRDRVYLTPEEVPLGQDVFIYGPGEDRPLLDEGRPVVLRRMIGLGRRIGARFYRDRGNGRFDNFGSEFAYGVRMSRADKVGKERYLLKLLGRHDTF